MIISLNTIGNCTLIDYNSNSTSLWLVSDDLFGQLLQPSLNYCVYVTLISNLHSIQVTLTLSGSLSKLGEGVEVSKVGRISTIWDKITEPLISKLVINCRRPHKPFICVYVDTRNVFHNTQTIFILWKLNLHAAKIKVGELMIHRGKDKFSILTYHKWRGVKNKAGNGYETMNSGHSPCVKGLNKYCRPW